MQIVLGLKGIGEKSLEKQRHGSPYKGPLTCTCKEYLWLMHNRKPLCDHGMSRFKRLEGYIMATISQYNDNKQTKPFILCFMFPFFSFYMSALLYFIHFLISKYASSSARTLLCLSFKHNKKLNHIKKRFLKFQYKFVVRFLDRF